MCAIAGIWRYDGRLSKEDQRDLKRMTDVLAHRGPDGEGCWSSRRLGLGSRRLAILDSSQHAAQPMLTPDGQGALVYNGEVYNYPQLRRELEKAGIALRSSGDTEVVLQALHHWGPGTAIPLFDGMFALAYFDRRTSTLWLARDRLGIKPLSILRSAKRLLFASEDKAFLATADGSKEIDAQLLALRFIRMNEANGTSLLKGVERLQPGTILKISDQEEVTASYWDILSAFDARRLTGDTASDRDKQLTVEKLVTSSVGMHLAADTPVAACLSGGVDSGMMTAIAARQRPGLCAFVIDPAFGPSESQAATRTAAMAGATLIRVSVSAEQLLRSWPKAILALESCGYAESDNALLAITERCRAEGIPVLLTGEGADELFGGYSRYRSSAKRWRLLDPPRIWFLSSRSRRRLQQTLALAPFAESMVYAKSGMPVWGLAGAAPGAAMLQRNCANAVGALSRFSDRGIVAASLYDMAMHLRELLHRHDRLGMAASVETRVPYLGNELIDFGMHLGVRHRMRYRTMKPLLKKVAENYIPRENIYRQKLGFPFTTAYSRGSQKLVATGYLKDVMRWSSIETRGVVEYCDDQPEFRLRLVGAELYARLFLAKQSPGELGELLVGAREDAGEPGLG